MPWFLLLTCRVRIVTVEIHKKSNDITSCLLLALKVASEPLPICMAAKNRAINI